MMKILKIFVIFWVMGVEGEDGLKVPVEVQPETWVCVVVDGGAWAVSGLV